MIPTWHELCMRLVNFKNLDYLSEQDQEIIRESYKKWKKEEKMAFLSISVTIHGLDGNVPVEEPLHRIMEAIDKEFPTLMANDIELQLLESAGFDVTALEYVVNKVNKEEEDKRRINHGK